MSPLWEMTSDSRKYLGSFSITPVTSCWCFITNVQLPSSRYSMRSPWVGSLALLAPARGFLTHSSATSGGSYSMQQTLARPATTGVRAIAGGWRQQARLRHRPCVANASPLCMKAGGNKVSASEGNRKPKKSKEKVESYYKNTVILPQTQFQQVGVGVYRDVEHR